MVSIPELACKKNILTRDTAVPDALADFTFVALPRINKKFSLERREASADTPYILRQWLALSNVLYEGGRSIKMLTKQHQYGDIHL